MDKRYHVEKEFEHEGYKCVVIMQQMGFRCGYVGITKDHPLYGCSYHDECETLKPSLEKLKEQPIGKRGIFPLVCWDGESVSPEMLFDVHGSVTYSGGGESSKYPIESALWWFGFDCGHAGDGYDYETADKYELSTLPKEHRMKFGDDIVRTQEYVEDECKSLADQLKSLMPETEATNA